MPKQTKELSIIAVNKLQGNGMYAVGGASGLYLKIDGNSKSWVFRATIKGERRNMGLGGYPAVTLSQARDLARESRSLIAQGIDPIENRQKLKDEASVEGNSGLTFDQASDRFISSKKAEWSSAKHAEQWTATLKTYASPIIGRLSVNDINKTHIIEILEPIWLTKTETASRLRGRIEQVVDWAIFCGYRINESNPARWRGYLDRALPKPTKVKKPKHHPAVPWEDAPLFIKELLNRKGITAKALLFHILTVARAGEVRFATWDEIDLKKKERFVPAEKMKMGRDHRVALSSQAVELLKSLGRGVDTSYIFPSPKGGALSDMAMTQLMRDMGFKDRKGDIAVPHGFRSTFTDWASEKTNHQSEVIKMAKAHVISDKVEGAYRRGELLEKRQLLMQDWANYCFGLVQPHA